MESCHLERSRAVVALERQWNHVILNAPGPSWRWSDRPSEPYRTESLGRGAALLGSALPGAGTLWVACPVVSGGVARSTLPTATTKITITAMAAAMIQGS